MRSTRLLPASARSGFTLVEIMMVIAVLALLGGLMMTNMDGVTQQERLKAAARKLAGTSDFVRSIAGGSRRMAFLDIDFDRSRWRFRQDPPQDPYGLFIDPEDGHKFDEDEIDAWRAGQEWESLPSGVYFKRHWINSKQFYEKQIITVEYRPDGTLDSFVLWLQGEPVGDEREGQIYSVVVNGLSGQSETHSWAAKFVEAQESDFSQVMGNDAPGTKR